MVLKIFEAGQSGTINVQLEISVEKRFVYTEHHATELRKVILDYLYPFIKEDK